MKGDGQVTEASNDKAAGSVWTVDTGSAPALRKCAQLHKEQVDASPAALLRCATYHKQNSYPDTRGICAVSTAFIESLPPVHPADNRLYVALYSALAAH